MIKLGILGCSEIAFRRFMPATEKVDTLQVVAIAEEYDKTKLEIFCGKYDLEIADDFDNLISRKDLDAIYIPQPPSLHYKWAKAALENGKHVLVEKPSTTSLEQSTELVEIARSRGLALHENYMFQYHNQIAEILELINCGEVGEPRLYRANFGFPLRPANDFRYVKSLGGGALIDAGGYTAKLATLMLGSTIKLDASSLNTLEGYEIDMFGSASFSNKEGLVFQVGYGMDCYYQCSLEVWGNAGKLHTNRIFTAPDGYVPTVIIEKADEKKVINLSSDSHFEKSIREFIEEISNSVKRESMYNDILLQARLMSEMRSKV